MPGAFAHKHYWSRANRSLLDDPKLLPEHSRELIPLSFMFSVLNKEFSVNSHIFTAIASCLPSNMFIALIATLVEMVVDGVSTRKVCKITRELCGAEVSKSTVSAMVTCSARMARAFSRQRAISISNG